MNPPYDEVLARIKPGKESLERPRAFVAELNERLKRRGVPADALLGGSIAKGTHLAGAHDVDVFVRYLGAVGAGLAAALPRTARKVHGSRDYYQLERDGLLYEVVPVKRITSAAQAENLTDVSPLHITHVAAALRQHPGLADHIRLAKQFCKAAKCYGAESYKQGLSGHVLDLLVLHYGGFTELLTAASAWGEETTIDPGKHHKDPRFSLNTSKHGPLLLVDPVQPDRNAAAALSRAQYERFKRAAKAHLKKPRTQDFEIEPLDTEAFAARCAGAATILTTHALDGKEDVVASKLRKVHEHLVRALRDEGFTVQEAWEYDPATKTATHCYCTEERLPATKTVPGPPKEMAAAAKDFTKKHPRARAKDGRLTATAKRAHTTPQALLAARLKDAYVRERAARTIII